jgi:DNA replicative helicase MCM subunit Mcm2 (Cdc46/Mcm family)
MAHPKKSSESWSKMVGAALVGAFLTGFTQYILNERQFEQRIKSEQKDIVRKYLESELSHRREKYAEIREKVSLAMWSKDPNTIEIAAQSLESDLPFFEARYETQVSVMTAKEKLVLYFKHRNSITISDIEKTMMINQLNRDFQNDLNRIQGELFRLSEAIPEPQSSVGSGNQQ